MLIAILLFCVGLFLIMKGGDWFTDSSVTIAKASNLPEVFIGATIVSIATTLPEMMVSVTAAIKGYTTMSLGNAIGSIIFNTGLILGLINLIKPNEIKGKIFKIKSIMMIIFLFLAYFLSYDGFIDKKDSILLLMLLLLYITIDIFILTYKNSQNKQRVVKEKLDMNKMKTINFFILGILGILLGANLIINNGVKIANYIGVPDSVISLSLIAFGTSLPELTTALASLKKGHVSLSIGNIIGANILNIIMVIGGSGIIQPIRIIKQNIILDFPVSILLVLIITLPTLFFNKVNRTQSILLLLIYVVYVFSLFSIYI